MIDVYVGIGANLGDAQATVKAAFARLAGLAQTRLIAYSSLFRTAPIDSSGDDYINAVAHLQTALKAEALLQELQAIELEFGRERPYQNAPRTLDLDILLYGSGKIASSTLTVPHPRMTERAFVLIPLLQLDPFVKIPGKGAAHTFAPAVVDQRISRLSE